MQPHNTQDADKCLDIYLELDDNLRLAAAR